MNNPDDATTLVLPAVPALPRQRGPGWPALDRQPRRPAAPVSLVARLLAEVAARCGEPLSVTVTGAICEAHVHVGTPAQFVDWCAAVGTASMACAPDTLMGDRAVAVAYQQGWLLHVELVGPLVAGGVR